MARVEVVGDRLSIQIEGLDRLWSLKSRLEIPLAHVAGVEADPAAARGWKGWRGPGAHVPGVIVSGTFRHQGDRVFWDVRNAAQAVVIRLTDEGYARLVIGVDDPDGTVATVRRALGTTGAGTGEPAASRKAVVEAYIEGFRRTDHEAILACLADDVVWVLHSYRTLRGKQAFDDEIENDAAVGSPRLQLDRVIEGGDTVVAVGSGEMTLKQAGRVPFVFAEVFAFTGDKISRLETFHINLDGPVAMPPPP